MNRDEKLTRPIGLPPNLRTLNGIKVLSPSEPNGGTWIALNETRVTLALINWYLVTDRVRTNPVSRGEIVKALSLSHSPDLVTAGLNRMPLRRINPFRLIGVFPASGEIVEWRWNLKWLVRKKAHWRTQQWISSGFDEPTAQRVRGEIFRQALSCTSVPGLSWLRKLHRSHAPHVGPFSTCMHRSDAATVSYTEVKVSPRVGTMRYHAGTPCERSACCCDHVRLRPSQSLKMGVQS